MTYVNEGGWAVVLKEEVADPGKAVTEKKESENLERQDGNKYFDMLGLIISHCSKAII